jgi:hypothetical protein
MMIGGETVAVDTMGPTCITVTEAIALEVTRVQTRVRGLDGMKQDTETIMTAIFRLAGMNTGRHLANTTTTVTGQCRRAWDTDTTIGLSPPAHRPAPLRRVHRCLHLEHAPTLRRRSHRSRRRLPRLRRHPHLPTLD